MKLCKSLGIFFFLCLVQFAVSRPRSRNDIRLKSQGKHDTNDVPREYPEEENIGNDFMEGDIYVDKHTKAVIENLLGGRDALSNPVKHWPNGIVPYMFASDVGESARKAFKEAIEEYHKHTCIRLVPRTGQRDYIYIVSEKGCFSTIGRSGNWQKLSLGPRCDRKGTAIHEIMHALGFFHEQSRLDRDNYITINWANIRKNMKFNFQKYRHGQADTLGEPYDYGSIMHYPGYAFSTNYKPTIVKKKAGPAIGQRIRLSKIDIKQINKLYKCNKRNTSPTPSQTTTLTTTTKPTTKPTTSPITRRPAPATKVRCYDSHFACPYYAFYARYCRHYLYGNWMRIKCPRSCGFCR